MTKTLLTLALLAASVPAFGQRETHATAREAALRFALANGVTIPTKDVIVVFDNMFQNIDRPVPTTSPEQLQSIARDMAKLIGEEARIGAADESLLCIRDTCIPKSKPVVVVNEPDNNSVFILVFLPSDRAEYDGYKVLAVVDVAPSEGRWFGTRVRLGPTKVGVKLNK